GMGFARTHAAMPTPAGAAAGPGALHRCPWGAADRQRWPRSARWCPPHSVPSCALPGLLQGFLLALEHQTRLFPRFVQGIAKEALRPVGEAAKVVQPQFAQRCRMALALDKVQRHILR